MANDYIPRQDSQIYTWETNFKTKLQAKAALLGLNPAEVTAVVNAVDDHQGTYDVLIAKKAELKLCEDDKILKRTIAVSLIRDIAAKCKSSTGYTEGIGGEIGIVSPGLNLDLLNAKPVVTHITQMIDMIVFDWVKSFYHGVVIYGAKRNTTNVLQTNAGSGTAGDDPAGLNLPQNLIWEEIARDFRSPYEDKRFNLTLQPEIRYYKFRYLYKDEIIGLDSDIIKVIAEIYAPQ